MITPPPEPSPRISGLLTPEQYRVHQRLQDDLEYFCKRALVIKLKEGGTAPFVWNKAQRYLHERIEDQLRRTGMVRMFIIKGRQQGISTYIAARLYHKITRQRAKNVFILSHHSNTTETLFQIVERYHENCPPEITPELEVNNNRRMKFKNSSQYTVATAGSGSGKGAGSVGRGDTNQYFHWSEVAFCDNTNELLTGVCQTVADIPGTEVYRESTANGVGNYFHQGCTDALAGKGMDELVFIPWYWQDEYRARIRDSDLLEGNTTEEEADLIEMYRLDLEQIQWRRDKIKFLKSKRLFKQEYPFTVEEAFQSSGNSLIDPERVAKARKSTIVDNHSPLILGVDPARLGDRTVITYRRGRHWIKSDIFHEMDEMLLAGKVSTAIDRLNVAKVFIDRAHGQGTIDRLHELGYGHIVQGVHFSESPSDERYVNKRAEMAGLLRDWFEEPGGCRVPDDEEIGVDLGAIPEFKITSNGLLQLESKDNIKKVFGKSPDIFDSAMLTFAYPVASEISRRNKVKQTQNTRSGSALSARRNRTAKPQNTDFDEDDSDRRGWTSDYSGRRRR